MSLFLSNGKGGRPAAVALPLLHHGEGNGSRRWHLAGLIVGLLTWLIALPFLGDPRISYQVTPVDADANPVLIARGSFAVTPVTEITVLEQPRGRTSERATYAQAEAAQPLLSAMAMPEVAAALGLVEPASLAPTAFDGSQPAPPHPMFSYPSNLPPGGTPSATLSQIMNPTEKPVLAKLSPTVMEGDSRLCSKVMMAVVSMRPGEDPSLLVAGTLTEVAEGPASPLIIEPGGRYDIALLVALPPDLPNEYQGASCTVNFLMEFEGA